MALIETLIDPFDSNTILAQWSLSGPGTPANQILCKNNRLELSSDGVNGDYFTMSSVSTYDLTGSSLKIQLVSAGNQLTNFDCIPLLAVNGTDELFWDINGGTISVVKKVAGVQTTILSSTYVASAYKWLKIRELGGTTYFDYSTDGRAWFNFTNLANPITVTSLVGGVQVGQFGVAAADTMIVDNFNYHTRMAQSPGLRPHPFSPGLAR